MGGISAESTAVGLHAQPDRPDALAVNVAQQDLAAAPAAAGDGPAEDWLPMWVLESERV